MKREEHIATMVTWVWQQLGVHLLPEGETIFVLTMFALLDDAIEDELRAQPSMYERAQKVSVN